MSFPESQATRQQEQQQSSLRSQLPHTFSMSHLDIPTNGTAQNNNNNVTKRDSDEFSSATDGEISNSATSPLNYFGNITPNSAMRKAEQVRRLNNTNNEVIVPQQQQQSAVEQELEIGSAFKNIHIAAAADEFFSFSGNTAELHELESSSVTQNQFQGQESSQWEYSPSHRGGQLERSNNNNNNINNNSINNNGKSNNNQGATGNSLSAALGVSLGVSLGPSNSSVGINPNPNSAALGAVGTPKRYDPNNHGIAVSKSILFYNSFFLPIIFHLCLIVLFSLTYL